MREVWRGVGQWLHEVTKHGEVGLHLVGLAPAGDQARLLVERGVDDVGDLRKRTECGAAGFRIGEIHGQVTELSLGRGLWRPAGDADGIPVLQLGEPVQH